MGKVWMYDGDKWVPAVPVPLYRLSLRGKYKCECGRYFWSYNNYYDHFLLNHRVIPMLLTPKDIK